MPSKQAWEYSRRCDGEHFKKNLKTVIKIRPKQAWVVENKKKGDFEMTNKEKYVLIDGLRKLAADVADLASMLEGAEATSQKQDVPTKDRTFPLRNPLPLPQRQHPPRSTPSKKQGRSSRRRSERDSGQRSKRSSMRTA